MEPSEAFSPHPYIYAHLSLIDKLCLEVKDDQPAWKRIDGAAVVEMARSGLIIKALAESPIEVQLGARLLMWLRIHFAEQGCSLCDFGKQGEAAASHILLVPQYVRGRFRYDFAIERNGSVLVFIECDGKEWHSSPDQIARDKRKDAAAAADGIAVLRFTGSRIVKSADDCVRDVIWHLRNVMGV